MQKFFLNRKAIRLDMARANIASSFSVCNTIKMVLPPQVIMGGFKKLLLFLAAKNWPHCLLPSTLDCFSQVWGKIPSLHEHTQKRYILQSETIPGLRGRVCNPSFWDGGI